jgi:hypothetical protein
MPHPTWIVEPLSGGHDREGFSCGNRALDHCLKEQANQDPRRACALPLVLIPSAGESAVLGYCTLSSFGIDAGVVPPEIAKELPRYPLIPATLLGRLAVDGRHHREGTGEFLLMDALRRMHYIVPGRNPAKSRLWRLWSRPLMNGPSGFTSISDSFLFRQSQAVYSL